MKEPTFKINPRFRLTTKHLSVVWHCVDKFTIECEATMKIPDQFVFQDKNAVELLVQYHDGILDMITMTPLTLKPRRYRNGLGNLCAIPYFGLQKLYCLRRGCMALALQSSAFGRMFSAIARSTITLPYNLFSLYSNRNGLTV